MTYTDLRSEFHYQDLVLWKNNDLLAENDEALNQGRVAYRRPVLQYIGATHFGVEANTDTLNTSTIIFPDGNQRTVTEDTSSSYTYRAVNLGGTANFISAEASGFRSGVSMVTNTWYAVYAVKSQVNEDNFVLVMDSLIPVQGNFSTLNTNFGSESWVYLGMVRVFFDSGLGFYTILSFRQEGNKTLFLNSPLGILLVSDSAAAITYTTVYGTGNLQIPNHFSIVTFMAHNGSITANYMLVKDSSGSRTYAHMSCDQFVDYAVELASSEGCRLEASTGTIAASIYLIGWIDNVLGIGPNPQI